MVTCPRCQHTNRRGSPHCEKCDAPLKMTLGEALSSCPEALIGKVINGKYKISGLLGVGGMGVVYKVRHLILQNRNIFALKILLPKFSSDEHFQRRFMREVELVMDLTHENIVQIREFGRIQGGLLFFTMDYFDGRPLDRWLREDGALPVARALNIVREILGTLREAHRAGIVHRDLKPENVLVATDEEGDHIRILDFGIAKVVEGEGKDVSLTQGGTIGTPKYMSPEQAMGEAVDARSDLYSLGILLYELITGCAPFSEGSPRSILMAQVTQAPPPLRKFAPGLRVPRRVESLIFKLLSKERDSRPSSADACLALVADCESTVSCSAIHAGSLPLLARLRSGPFLRFAALLALIASLLGGSLYWLRKPVVSARGAAARGTSARGHGADETSPPESVVPASRAAELKAERTSLQPNPTRRRTFECLYCGQSYPDRQKSYNRCHGEPMVEVIE